MSQLKRPVGSCSPVRLYLEQSDFHERFSGSDFNVERSSRSVTCQTFELTLRSCLYPHIERRYIECCGNLMKTLKKDYRWVFTPSFRAVVQDLFLSSISASPATLRVSSGSWSTFRP